MSLITASNMSLSHGRKIVLNDVDLTIERGEIVTIVGPNGSGKSTLLRGLIGALRPSTGLVTRKKDLKIGYVPQKLELNAALPLTVRRFLDLPNRVTQTDAIAALQTAGVADHANAQMTNLSGGQFQRVLLARALLIKPDVLMLDEATQGLDQPGSAAFYRQIEAVRQDLNCAVIMVSHDLHVVMAASDRVLCLNGHICCQGSPDIVASAPEYRALFGSGTQGALALYRHEHTHDHHDHSH
jgi:zinc transport system ATP-binding protein